jgi:DNA-binding beta-propeller fold protein YncE
METCDELLVDPLGTWVLAVGRRPGRFTPLPVDPSGRFGAPGEAVLVGHELAAVATAPGGALVAIAVRAPAAVHTYSLLQGNAQLVQSIPLDDSPDALAFDATGRALYVTHTAADRLTAVALDGHGCMEGMTTVVLPGGPGPLALAPSGDVLFVGLHATPGIVPCDVGARSRQLTVRTGLGVELPCAPVRLEFAADRVALLAACAQRAESLRIDRHPATGALSLGYGTLTQQPNAAESALASEAAFSTTARIEFALPPPSAPAPLGRVRQRPAPPDAEREARARGTSDTRN